MPINKRLRRAEAAKYLDENHGIRRTVGTLAKLAVIGGGPRFRVANRTPLYETDELDAWVESILSPLVASTSELRAVLRGDKYTAADNAAVPATAQPAEPPVGKIAPPEQVPTDRVVAPTVAGLQPAAAT